VLSKEAFLRERENPPSAENRGSLNEHSTFELQENHLDFDYNKNNSPIFLVPACSPLRDSKTTTGEAKPTSYFVTAAKWEPSTESWDVDFGGSIVLAHDTLQVGFVFLLSLFVAGIPFAIIGGLSHSQYGKSTFAQRAWITAWLCVDRDI
jgi:hypothetical protein